MGLVLNLQIMLSMMMVDGYDEYDVYDDGYDANDFFGGYDCHHHHHIPLQN